MCDEDLHSWGWTDLCVPPVVLESMGLLAVCLNNGFISLLSVAAVISLILFETETLTSTLTASFTLVSLHSMTLSRTECGPTLDLVAASFGLV